ncbi:MAG TPA: NADH-quinone oxidoreductase subunit C [Melioribacteraceae bacterium]|nr:NADH-quinone oxidoreductase subunit C [Melioribacteraceae bacterium]
MDLKQLIIEKIKGNFPDAVSETTDFRDDLSVTVKSDTILGVAKYLKEDNELQFEMCKDVTAIDWATRKNRFAVVYHIYSFKLNFNLRLKSIVEVDPPVIDSVTSVWPGADWYERETYDMYGIVFNNHPDLRRMYMPEGFQYHPLRKDFPVLGIPDSLPLPEKI